VEGLIAHGVKITLDTRLIKACEEQEHGLIPIVIYTNLHREILRVHTFKKLIEMRSRIWHDVQIIYSLTKAIRFVFVVDI
jgi:hypothetical protein